MALETARAHDVYTSYTWCCDNAFCAMHFRTARLSTPRYVCRTHSSAINAACRIAACSTLRELHHTQFVPLPLSKFEFSCSNLVSMMRLSCTCKNSRATTMQHVCRLYAWQSSISEWVAIETRGRDQSASSAIWLSHR